MSALEASEVMVKWFPASEGFGSEQSSHWTSQTTHSSFYKLPLSQECKEAGGIQGPAYVMKDLSVEIKIFKISIF